MWAFETVRADSMHTARDHVPPVCCIFTYFSPPRYVPKDATVVSTTQEERQTLIAKSKTCTTSIHILTNTTALF